MATDSKSASFSRLVVDRNGSERSFRSISSVLIIRVAEE